MIALPPDKIASFCQKHGVVRAAVFGSALGSGHGSDSDVDILVEFAPGRTPGLAFFAMQDELTAILGRPVDLQTAGFLSRHFRDRVAGEAETIYDAAR